MPPLTYKTLTAIKKNLKKKIKAGTAWAQTPDSPLLRFLAEQVGQCLAKLKPSTRLGPRQTLPTASPKPPARTSGGRSGREAQAVG